MGSTEAPGKVKEGHRNDTLFRLGASLRTKGMTVGEISAALLEANRQRCSPPLPDREVTKIAESCGRYRCGAGEKPYKSAKPSDYSDAGNAEVFVQQLQRRSDFCRCAGLAFTGLANGGSETIIRQLQMHWRSRGRCCERQMKKMG